MKIFQNIGLPLSFLVLFSCGSSGRRDLSTADSVARTTASPADTNLIMPDSMENAILPFDSVVGSGRVDGPVAMQSHSIHLQKGVDLRLRLPVGYAIGIAFEGLDRLRFLCKSPDRRLFATDLFDISDNWEAKVYVFDDWDSVHRQFRTIRTYLDSLHNPNQVAFYRDKGKDYIYIAETGVLSRYVYHSGDTIPSGNPEVIATFPDYGLSYKYGGWHLTRSLAFHDKKLYVSVGSSCNACIENEAIRATIIEMNPDGSDERFFATGLRNSVGIKWVGHELWTTFMGRDLIGADKPEDLFGVVERGKFYGWPYYFQYRDSVYDDKPMQNAAIAQHVPIPARPAPAWCGFKAHSAPLGFDYFSNFEDDLLKNAFLVALHGSTMVSRQRGNAIVKITGRNKYIPIVDGFLNGKTDKDRKGRPCDVLMDTRRSFFFTDDLNGVLYYVWKE
jgi:glucose/arabinose dehydrogenase